MDAGQFWTQFLRRLAVLLAFLECLLWGKPVAMQGVWLPQVCHVTRTPTLDAQGEGNASQLHMI